MHATYRKIRVQPGKTAEVAELIRTDYLALIDDVPGFVSYTLVDLGDDEISSVGVFETKEAAEEANARAKSWTAEHLAPHVASPLEAHEGPVLVRV